MILIIVIVALTLETRIKFPSFVRDYLWLNRPLQQLLHWTGPHLLWQLVVLALTIFIAAFAAQAIGGLLCHLLLGLPYGLWSLLILLLCIGPISLRRQFKAYLQALDAEDEPLADQCAHKLQGLAGAGGTFSSAEVRNAAVLRALFHQINRQLLAVLFWFVLLGPFGAVMYRVVLHLFYFLRTDADHAPLLDRMGLVLGVLLWLPARLLVLGYALMGRFDSAVESMSGAYFRFTFGPQLLDETDKLLAKVGMRAIGSSAGVQRVSRVQLRAGNKLITRALLLCLVPVALLTF